jgi:exosortase/archaeosortase family protein
MEVRARVRVVAGSILILISLVILRYFQLSGPDLFWIVVMGCGVVVFAVGSRWVLYDLRFFSGYRDMWPVLCAAMVVAWLIHAVQLESYASSSPLGVFFGTVNVFVTVALLHLTNIPVTVSGDILSFGPPSMIGGVEVTPLCGGFLSFLMFIAAFSFVTVDIGRSLGVLRLAFLLLTGVGVTFAATILRVYVVILVGFRWGLNALYLAHTYLGYAIFLTVACGFWYAALTWNKHLSSGPAKQQVGGPYQRVRQLKHAPEKGN